MDVASVGEEEWIAWCSFTKLDISVLFLENIEPDVVPSVLHVYMENMLVPLMLGVIVL